ncbi:hypothetical protein CTA2_10838 [Colletotrichum tanaceti]|uniref:N-acetyltransferase domain-containing protein n=1 Tax=Colletotrichum tanaceti TaxID=1306861 RepID=A0A4U6XM08_9PEZI|nr:hypothetical protein CTA2_10838 [Colletotrichum tanaceti]TKW56682.1 hypothetical protein CTA1_1549 [Colletotrichum tanaceti]
MAPWKTEPCTLADVPALARDNMSAFWTDPNWVLLWPKLDFLIEQVTEHMPSSPLGNRATMRHQKAVDPETGAVNKSKGIATAFVQNGVRLAEETGADVFILAFPAGLNVYKRLGFKERHRGYQDDTKHGGRGYWVTLLTYEVSKDEFLKGVCFE